MVKALALVTLYVFGAPNLFLGKYLTVKPLPEFKDSKPGMSVTVLRTRAQQAVQEVMP